MCMIIFVAILHILEISFLPLEFFQSISQSSSNYGAQDYLGANGLKRRWRKKKFISIDKLCIKEIKLSNRGTR